MPSVGEVLDQISRDLNDFEGGHAATAWSRDQLRWYLREGFGLILQAMPGIFDKTKTARLEPGQLYYDLCGCGSLRNEAVLGQCDAAGAIIRPIRPRGDSLRDQWLEPPRSPGPFKLREFSISPDGRSIRVYPMVPPGHKVWIALRCADYPEKDSDEVRDEAAIPAIQWSLYRAKMVDGESGPASLYAAITHWQTCAALLGIKLPQARRASRSAQAPAVLQNAGVVA